MATNKVLPFPPTDPADAELDRLIAEVEEDIEETGGGIAAYAWNMTDLLRVVAIPYADGWVASETACFQRRTKAEFVKMFELNEGKILFSLLGFRDVEEALLCEAAAIEAGSSWRFIDFFRQDKVHGTGLGSLNDALDEYRRYYRAGLCPTDQFPAPPPKG